MLAYKALKKPLRSAVPAGQSATTGFKILRVWLEECHLGISAADVVVLFTGSRAFLGRCYRLRQGGLGRRHVPPGWTMRCLQRHRIVSDTAWPSTALPHVYSSRTSNRPMSQGWMFSTHIGWQLSPCYASSNAKKNVSILVCLGRARTLSRPRYTTHHHTGSRIGTWRIICFFGLDARLDELVYKGTFT